MRWWRVIGTVLAGVAVLSIGLLLSAVAVAQRGRPDDLTPLTEAEIEAIAVRVGESTVRVEAETCAGGMTASGFVAGARVVTSGHLVSGAADFTFDGPHTRGRVAVAEVLDAADLGFSEPLGEGGGATGPSLTLADGGPADGSPVVMLGRPGGRLRWLAAVARTVDGTAYGASGPLLVLDRAVAPGWSGGPVVDRAGRVVGVVRAVVEAADITLADPAYLLPPLAPEWHQDDIDRAAPSSCKSDDPKG